MFLTKEKQALSLSLFFFDECRKLLFRPYSTILSGRVHSGTLS